MRGGDARRAAAGQRWTLLLLLAACVLSLALQPVLARSSSQFGGSVVARGERVKVEYYVEAMCARCIDVMSNALPDALRRVGGLIDLDLVPAGNVEINGKSVQCQHGPQECRANTFQACVQAYHPSVDQWFAFIMCMERGNGDPLSRAPGCVKRLKLNEEKIAACVDSDEGQGLLLANARRTLTLQPPARFVPWLVVNGEPYSDHENLVAAVCSQYEGDDKDKWCQNTARFERK